MIIRMIKRKRPAASFVLFLAYLIITQSKAFLILRASSTQSQSQRRSIRSILADGSRGDFFDELPEKETQNDRSQIFSSSPSDPEAHIPRLNIVTLVGRIGQTPAPRYFDDGKVVLALSLAVKRKYHPLERKAKNIKTGEEETDWFNLELWGRDAEYATKYVTKGARVGITGSLACDSWVDRNTGDKRQRFKIVVKHLDILESRAEADMRSGDDSKEKYKYRIRSSYYDEDNYDEDQGPSSGGSGSFFDM